MNEVEQRAASGAARELWLGLDTGGTYTDAVLLEAGGRVLVSAKALTTREDLSVGLGGAIRAILAKLPDGFSRRDVSLVSVSTTLATNAVVERRFSPICSLLIGFDEAMVERSGLPAMRELSPLERIGGGHGWYACDWLWQLRGWMDRCIGGPGMSRGRRDSERLAAGDTLVIETGTCMLHANALLLPDGVDAEGQGLWGSIGWATPACLGVAMAKTAGRAVLVTGDGAHQLTLNEIAVMGRYGVKPVIFVLNNGLYGVEDMISERGHAYDDLAPVNYAQLPAAFGCKGWLTGRVGTVAELDRMLDAIDAHDGAAYVEVMIPGAESQPLPDATIDRGYKLRTPKAD
jgi:hypothetical protein